LTGAQNKAGQMKEFSLQFDELKLLKKRAENNETIQIQ